MLLILKRLFYLGESLIMLIYHAVVSCEVDSSFSNTAGYVHSFFTTFCGVFCFVNGRRQECLFILFNDFLQANADLPYRQNLRFPVFQASNCVIQSSGKFHFVRLFPLVE